MGISLHTQALKSYAFCSWSQSANECPESSPKKRGCAGCRPPRPAFRQSPGRKRTQSTRPATQTAEHPLFSAPGPATGSFNGLHPKSKFLAASTNLAGQHPGRVKAMQALLD